MRDDWFDWAKAPQQPFGWIPKPAITKVYEQLSKAQKAKDQAFRHVAQKAAQRLQLDKENEELLIQAATDYTDELPPAGPGYPPNSKKGKAKAQAPKRIVSRQEAWETIMKQQDAVHGSFIVTLNKQREVNRLVSDYRSAYGNSPPP